MNFKNSLPVKVNTVNLTRTRTSQEPGARLGGRHTVTVGSSIPWAVGPD